MVILVGDIFSFLVMTNELGLFKYIEYLLFFCVVITIFVVALLLIILLIRWLPIFLKYVVCKRTKENRHWDI